MHSNASLITEINCRQGNMFRSTSKGHHQASGTKYIEGIVYSFKYV